MMTLLERREVFVLLQAFQLGHRNEEVFLQSNYSALPMRLACHSSWLPTPKGSICGPSRLGCWQVLDIPNSRAEAGANRGTCGCASLRAHIEHVIQQCRCEPASICSLKTSNHSQNLPSPIRGRQENGYPRKLHDYKCLVHRLWDMVNGYL